MSSLQPISHRIRTVLQRVVGRGPRPRFKLIVGCGPGGHKVRLDPRRFWREARCPVCKTTVDRTRFRRVGNIARDFFWSGLPKGRARAVRLAAWIYLGVGLVAWATLYGLGDRWWPGTLLLFGPRWILLLPIAFLVPLAIRLRVSALIPLGATLVVLLFPIMGMELGWRGLMTRVTRDPTLRIITFNTMNGGMRLSAVPELLDLEPDVLGFQECGTELGDMLARLNEWYAHQEGGICLLSRYPIEQVDAMERDHLRQAGGAGVVIRFGLRTPERMVWLTNLHLDTPRRGLTPIRKGELGSGIDVLRTKQFTRDIESKQARQWVDAPMSSSTIVIGDFNMPVESVIYRRHWRDLRNAFSGAGLGFGATRDNGWIQVRIDHVLMGPGWRPLRATVGPTYGSDHRPVIADLAWVGD